MTDPPYRGLIYFEENVGLPDAMRMKGPNDSLLLFGPLGIFNIMIFFLIEKCIYYTYK